MEKLVSSWFNAGAIPETYVFPPEKRPGKLIFPLGKSIPVLDLGSRDRNETIQQIMKASEEFGFFQVVNYGISIELMDDTVAVVKDFHTIPAKDKVSECSEDPNRSSKLYPSSGNYAAEEIITGGIV